MRGRKTEEYVDGSSWAVADLCLVGPAGTWHKSCGGDPAAEPGTHCTFSADQQVQLSVFTVSLARNRKACERVRHM